MKANYKFGVIITIILLLIIISFSSSLGAIGVQPLVLDLEMNRGETKEFELKLTPEQNQATVALNLYYPRQQQTGNLSYEEGDLEEHAVLKWLELPEEVAVPPGEETTVDVEVTAPHDAKGTHTAIIMAEPVVEEAEQGITFRVRYAVRVNIHVDAPGLMKKAEVTNFELTANEEDRPLIQANIKNSSSLSYNAAGEVTIRDKNRNLIERIPIRSQYAAQGGRDETTIYPGSEVIFSGNVTEPLPEGTYDMQLYLYYADGRQVIKRKTIEVRDQFIDPENLEYIEVKPEIISEELRRGGAHTEAINIRNRMGDPLNIKIGTKKISSEYEHSLLNKFKLELRGDQQFKLEGRRSQRPVLIARAPRENIEDGGYYDTLQIGVFDPETEEKLQVKEIPMQFVVGEDYEYNGEVQGITAQRMENEVLLSTPVLNTGDIHFSPQARVYLIQEEEIKHTLFLEMAEEEDMILPERKGILSTYAQDIEPGEYTAEVTLRHEGEEISVEKFDLKVEKNEKEAKEKATDEKNNK